MKQVIEDLNIQCEIPTKMFCYNKSTINIAHNSVQHDKTKHIEIWQHFIKKILDNKLITTAYIPFGYQLAYVLSKGLQT